MDKCPCIDCICVPTCMHRGSPELARTCQLIATWLTQHEIGLRMGSHRVIYIEPLDQTYRVYKSQAGRFSWVAYKGKEEEWKT